MALRQKKQIEELQTRIAELEKRSDDPPIEVIDVEDDERVNPKDDQLLSVEQLAKSVNVYRAMQVHTTTIKQLDLNVFKKGKLKKTVPTLIQQPTLNEPREIHHEKTIVSLMKHGNAYWLKHFPPLKDENDEIVTVEDPDTGEITIVEDFNKTPLYIERLIAKYVTAEPRTDDPTKIYRYAYNVTSESSGGEYYWPWQIEHLAVGRSDDSFYGIAPLEAGVTELSAAKALSDYVAQLVAKNPTPQGTIEGEDDLTPEITEEVRTEFNKTHGGKVGVAVFGNGFKYKTQMLNPDQLQYIQSRNYDVVNAARLLGISPTLMLAFIEGSTQTYQNVSQEWLAFIRFSHANYLVEIEIAYTNMLGKDDSVKFNLSKLLRSDDFTRFQIWKLNKEAGEILTRAEIRLIEELDPTDTRDFAEMLPTSTTPETETTTLSDPEEE